MVIKPLNDLVLVTEEVPKTTTTSGIIIEGTNSDSKLYRVVDVGPDVVGVPVGSIFVIDISKVTAIKQGGKFMGLIKQENLLAWVQE